MDDDMDDMTSSMDGMDMSTSGLFRTHNQALAELFWYILTGVVALGFLWRTVGATDVFLRRRRCLRADIESPTRPINSFWQLHATMTAIFREITYPALLFKNPWFEWLSPPPLGRSLLLIGYWALMLGLLLSGSVMSDAYYWERIGFRAAWISVTQLPLVFLLASKNNIIGYFIGLSHGRLNWLHRWVSRTLLITATIHGSFFLREWTLADFVALELEIMPMVKYGMGAWAVLTWTFLSSLSPLRRVAYEFFVLQHLVAAVVVLWLLHVHVPSYAQYNVWFAIAVLSADFAIKAAQTLYCNIPRIGGAAGFGHIVELVSSDADWTEVKIKNIHFSWAPGQYIYLWLPLLGPLETHPFTIANAHRTVAADSNHIQLVVRSQKGFSRRLHKHAIGKCVPSIMNTVGVVRGPYGTVPAWDAFESVVLISSSTGASFTNPILQDLMGRTHRGNIRYITMLLVAKNEREISWYTEHLDNYTRSSRNLGIELRIRVAITQQYYTRPGSKAGSDLKSINSSKSSAQREVTEVKNYSRKDTEALMGSEEVILGGPWPATDDYVTTTYGRPNTDQVIRQSVERSSGETIVAVCGARELTTSVRNSVARLSDERAVHKGTGAQGIRLHVEAFEL